MQKLGYQIWGNRWSRSFRQPPTVFKWFAAPVLIPHPSFSVYSNKPRPGSCRLTAKGYTRKYLSEIWNRHSGTDLKYYEATRHSYCTYIVPLANPLDAQRLMRHKDRRSTDNYYHAYNERLLDIVQRMDNVVDIKEVKKRKRKGNEI
jgi:hypothetical protein